MLRDCLKYNAETGQFYWLVNRAGKRIGDLAGNVGPNGYRTIMVNYRAYYAHHLAIFFMTGEWPPKKSSVDHRNGKKDDNRFNNLRVTNQSINGLNRATLNKNNTSGATGVWQTPSGRFLAYIDINYKRRRIWLFDDFESAVKARRHVHAAASN